MPKNKLFIFFLAILLVASLEALAIPQVGDMAPDFTLPALEGNNFQLSQFIASPGGTKGVVLNFFSVGCRPCKYELPELEKLYQQYKDKGIKMVALCLDDDLTGEQIKKFVKKMGLTFPVVLDGDWKAAQKYGVRPIPNTFIIGPHQKIEGRYIGYSNRNMRAIEKLVSQLAQ